MNTSEIKIRGKRFVLIPKKDFDVIRRRAAKNRPARVVPAPDAGNRRAIALLDQWQSSPETADDSYWKVLQSNIAANRFHFRAPVED